MDYEKELDKLRGCVCCSWLLALGNNHLAFSQEKKKKNRLILSFACSIV